MAELKQKKKFGKADLKMIIIFIVFLRVLPVFQLIVNLANCGLGFYSQIHPEKCLNFIIILLIAHMTTFSP